VSSTSRLYRKQLRRGRLLDSAHGLVVVGPSGALTLLAHPDLDRAGLSQALVAMAFSLAETGPAALAVPTQRVADQRM